MIEIKNNDYHKLQDIHDSLFKYECDIISDVKR